MKQLSSDTLYYKGLIGYIIGPVLILLFVNFFMDDDKTRFAKDATYILLIILLITQGRLIYKTRQVFYNNTIIVLKNKLIRQSEEIYLTDIISLKKAFSLQKEKNRNLFKLTYSKGNKVQTIYFFRNLELSVVDDLSAFIGLNELIK